MAEKRVYCRNFVRGKRGPCSAILVQDEDGTLYVGTIYFLEVPGGDDVASAGQAQEFCDNNVDFLIVGIHHQEDDGIIAGWSGRPWTEQAMIADALKEARWT